MYNHEMEINVNYEKIKVKCTNDVVAWRNTLLLLYHYSGRRESLWRLARLSWPTPQSPWLFWEGLEATLSGQARQHSGCWPFDRLLLGPACLDYTGELGLVSE